ncbi:MAG: serine hydrolase domain-containing protein [Bacteroidota bacterium]
MKYTITTLLTLAIGISVSAQATFTALTGNQESLDSLVSLIELGRKQLNMAGLSFALIEEGRVVLDQTFGYQNAERRDAISASNTFEAASMSKPVFAFLVMRLVERKVIDLDKPLYEYYTYTDLQDDPNYKRITARHVLTHQTGLPNWRYGRPLTTNFTPGTDFSYSGEGFVYLGKVLEHLMNVPLQELFQKEVFRPLGMTHSTFIWSPFTDQDKVTGHYNGNVVSTDYYRPLVANPAASLITNTGDFAKFMLAIMNQEILSELSYAEMLRIQVTPALDNSHQNEDGTINWGLAWVIEEMPNGYIYQHGGNNGDFESYFQISFDRKSAYVYFTNSDQGDELNAWLKPFINTGVWNVPDPNTLDAEYEVEFDPEFWEIVGAHERIKKDGKAALAFAEDGMATLKEVAYKDMIVEFDVAFPKGYCNAGINFRAQDTENYEQYYLRAHESGTSHAMQYTPVFNDVSGWQLYSGYNYTGVTTHYRDNQWMHVRMAILDDWMEVHVDDMDNLALHVFDLKHPYEKGEVTLWTDNHAYFANFRIKEIEDYDFYYDYQPKPKPSRETIAQWELSEAFHHSDLDDRNPSMEFIDALSWEQVYCEYNGLVNLARYRRLTDDENTVIARVNIVSDRPQSKSVQFGYSDIGKIFLNGKILYDGQRMYQSRDNDYRGTIGYHQRLFLELEEGENELWFVVTENFGGWGLMMKFDDLEGIELGQ